ncbi:MAG: FecR domain-containing protein, partial [Mariprofundus sp.]|nr:FecR domain-containing protein [Mariprofundus sp.]
MRMFKQCLCAMFVVCLWSGTLLAAAGVAEFKKVHGMVDVFHVGERQAVSVTVGDSLAVGDIVRTGKRSRAQLKFADGSVLNIGSLSKIQVGEFSFSADSKVRKTSISDLRGKVRALVTKSTHKDSFFQVKTPGAVAAVRGTDYGVDVISPRETVVVTYSGAVAVGTLDGFKKGKTVMLLANQITRVVQG